MGRGRLHSNAHSGYCRAFPVPLRRLVDRGSSSNLVRVEQLLARADRDGEAILRGRYGAGPPLVACAVGVVGVVEVDVGNPIAAAMRLQISSRAVSFLARKRIRKRREEPISRLVNRGIDLLTYNGEAETSPPKVLLHLTGRRLHRNRLFVRKLFGRNFDPELLLFPGNNATP